MLTRLDFADGKFVQTRRDCRQLVANCVHTADACVLGVSYLRQKLLSSGMFVGSLVCLFVCCLVELYKKKIFSIWYYNVVIVLIFLAFFIYMQQLLWSWCLHVARFHSWPNLVVQEFGILQRRQCRGTFVILLLWSLCDQVYKLLFDAKPNRFCSVKYWLQLFLWLFLVSKWLHCSHICSNALCVVRVL